MAWNRRQVTLHARQALLPVLAALLLGGCELTPSQEFVPEMSVHGIIWRGSNEHPSTPVFLNRTYAIDEAPASLLHGADVMVTRNRRAWPWGADTFRFEESYRSWRRHQWVSGLESAYACPQTFSARGGDTLRLQVAHPDFDTLRAQTVVPDTFWIVHPDSGDTVTARDSLVFRRSRGAFGYLISFEASFQGEDFWGYVVIPQDSIRGVPYDSLYARVPLLWLNYIAPGPQPLRVMAMDSNYSVWMAEAGGSSRRGFFSAGVENGVGVFGSGSEAEVEVIVSRDSSAACPGRTKLGADRRAAAGLLAPGQKLYRAMQE